MIVEVESDTQDTCVDFIEKAGLKTRNADSARIRELHCDCRDIDEHADPLNRVKSLFGDDLSNGRNYLFSDIYNPFVVTQMTKYGDSVCLLSNRNECRYCQQKAQGIDSGAKQSQDQTIPADAPVQGGSNAEQDIIPEVVRILEIELGHRDKIIDYQRKDREEREGEIDALRTEIAEERERKRKKKLESA